MKNAEFEAALRVPVSDRWLSFGLFALAFGSRVAVLNPGFFHHDAVRLLMSLELSFRTGSLARLLEGRYAYVALHLPLYGLLRVLDYPSGLPVDIALNLFTAGIAAISVALLYDVARRLDLPAMGAGAAALCFCFTPVYFSVTTHTMVHAASVALSLGAFSLLLRANASGSALGYIASSLSLAAAVSVRFPNVLLVIPFAIAYLRPSLRGRNFHIPRERFSKHLVALAVPFSAVLAIMLAVQWEAIGSRSGADPYLGPFSPILFDGLENVFLNFGLLGTACIAAGAWLSFRRPRRSYMIALLVWTLTLFFFYSNMRSYTHRFLSILYPCLAIFIAVALLRIARWNRGVALAVLAGILASMLATVGPIVWARRDFSGEKAYALWLGAQTEADALVIATDDWVFIEYYAKREVSRHPVSGDPATVERWVKMVAREVSAGRPVYLAEDGLRYDVNHLISRALRRHFKWVAVGESSSENYHRAEIRRNLRSETLVRLSLNEANPRR